MKTDCFTKGDISLTADWVELFMTLEHYRSENKYFFFNNFGSFMFVLIQYVYSVFSPFPRVFVSQFVC